MIITLFILLEERRTYYFETGLEIYFHMENIEYFSKKKLLSPSTVVPVSRQ